MADPDVRAATPAGTAPLVRLGDRARVPLGLQLGAALTGLLALVAAGVLLAVSLLVDLRQDVTRLADRRVAYGNAVDAAALHAKGIANDERGYLISGRGEFLTQLRGRAVAARAEFALAARNAAGGAQHDAIAEASAGFERWLQAVREELRLYGAGQEDAAVRASLGETRALRKSYEKSLATAQALGSRGVESAGELVTEESQRSVRILLVFLAGALALGVVLFAWVIALLGRARAETASPEPR